MISFLHSSLVSRIILMCPSVAKMDNTILPSASGLRRSTRLLKGELSTCSSYEAQSEFQAVCSSPKHKRTRTVYSSSSESTRTSVDGAGSEAARSRSEKMYKNSPKKIKLDEDSDDASKPKRTRKRQNKPEPVYVIPDIESKTTTFRGRLGYACLNTVLRSKRPASDSVFCSRTCRLDTLKKNGIDWVKDLGRRNVEDLFKMIQWNEENHIRFLRLSSEMFPYASHGIHGYSLQYCADLLEKVGALANKYGHRLTTHPGQFTQLGSPKPEVVTASIRELVYHCEMLDLMGIGPDGVMIIHGGGMYDNKHATLERIKSTIKNSLPLNVRDRLVLENDEMCYNAEDLLPLCEELDVPFVFDYHHDTLFPSSIPPAAIIKRANAIWSRRRIRPKQHLSEQRPGAVSLMERRAHADRCQSLPPDLPDDMDLMIEAKDKEQAVLHLYRMYNLQPVNYASLRPPNPNPTKETQGRKSTKRIRAKTAKLAESIALLDQDLEGNLLAGDESSDAEVLQEGLEPENPEDFQPQDL